MKTYAHLASLRGWIGCCLLYLLCVSSSLAATVGGYYDLTVQGVGVNRSVTLEITGMPDNQFIGNYSDTWTDGDTFTVAWWLGTTPYYYIKCRYLDGDGNMQTILTSSQGYGMGSVGGETVNFTLTLDFTPTPKTYTLVVNHTTHPDVIGSSALNVIAGMDKIAGSAQASQSSSFNVAPSSSGNAVFSMSEAGTYLVTASVLTTKINPADHPTAPNQIVPTTVEVFSETYVHGGATNVTRYTTVTSGNKSLREWIIDGGNYNNPTNVSTANNATNTLFGTQGGGGTLNSKEYQGTNTTQTGIIQAIGNAGVKSSELNGEALAKINQTLEGIRGNQRGESNLLLGIYTNMYNLSTNRFGSVDGTNLAEGFHKTATNLLASKTFDSTNVGSVAASAIASQKDGLDAIGSGLNGINQGTIGSIDDSFYHISIPGGYTMNLNPLANEGIAVIASGTRSILVWLITCVYFIALWQCFDTKMSDVTKARQASTAGTTVLGENVNAVSATLMATAITVAALAIPGFMVAWWSDHGSVSSFLSAGPLSGVTGIFAHSIALANAFIPLDVIIADVVGYMVFRVSCTSLYFTVSTIIRYLVGL